MVNEMSPMRAVQELFSCGDPSSVPTKTKWMGEEPNEAHRGCGVLPGVTSIELKKPVRSTLLRGPPKNSDTGAGSETWLTGRIAGTLVHLSQSVLSKRI